MSQNVALPFAEVPPGVMPGAREHARPLHSVARWRGMDMRVAGIVRSK
jgi:hypothetical protein